MLDSSEEEELTDLDLMQTAAAHHRLTILTRALHAWRSEVPVKQQPHATSAEPDQPSTPIKRKADDARSTNQRTDADHDDSPLSPRPSKIPGRFPPGMTGLRNLGQTCYMNSVLQALSHSELLRSCFAMLGELGLLDPSLAADSIASLRAAGVKPAGKLPRLTITRQTTVECHTKLETQSPAISALKRRKPVDGASGDDKPNMALCHNLESLFRVIWSGKWAVVTPHALLGNVWELIPYFRGFQQQDAQELLCGLADRIQMEIDALIKQVSPVKLPALVILRQAFGGEITSTVKCGNCKSTSARKDNFYDISLDFPTDSQPHGDLSDFLELFARDEAIDGDLYQCDACSKGKDGKLTPRPATVSHRISIMPGILRLHLKRFRWSGTRREKINSPITFPTVLDLQPYCELTAAKSTFAAAGVVIRPNEPDAFKYELIGAIVHHGRSINAGHYTSYCFNQVTGKWTHFNDARVTPCEFSDVQKECVYVLLYSYKCANKLASRLRAVDDMSLKRPRLDRQETFQPVPE